MTPPLAIVVADSNLGSLRALLAGLPNTPARANWGHLGSFLQEYRFTLEATYLLWRSLWSTLRTGRCPNSPAPGASVACEVLQHPLPKQKGGEFTRVCLGSVSHCHRPCADSVDIGAVGDTFLPCASFSSTDVSSSTQLPRHTTLVGGHSFLLHWRRTVSPTLRGSCWPVSTGPI